MSPTFPVSGLGRRGAANHVCVSPLIGLSCGPLGQSFLTLVTTKAG